MRDRRSTARQGSDVAALSPSQSGGTGPRQAYPRHDTAAEFAEFIAHNRREFLAERLPNETGPEWLARTNRGGRYL